MSVPRRCKPKPHVGFTTRRALARLSSSDSRMTRGQMYARKRRGRFRATCWRCPPCRALLTTRPGNRAVSASIEALAVTSSGGDWSAVDDVFAEDVHRNPDLRGEAVQAVAIRCERGSRSAADRVDRPSDRLRCCRRRSKRSGIRLLAAPRPHRPCPSACASRANAPEQLCRRGSRPRVARCVSRALGEARAAQQLISARTTGRPALR